MLSIYSLSVLNHHLCDMARQGWYKALANALQKEDNAGQYPLEVRSCPHHSSPLSRRAYSHATRHDRTPQHAPRPIAHPTRLPHRIHPPHPPPHPLHDRHPNTQNHPINRPAHRRDRILDAEHPRTVSDPRTGVDRVRAGPGAAPAITDDRRGVRRAGERGVRLGGEAGRGV